MHCIAWRGVGAGAVETGCDESEMSVHSGSMHEVLQALRERDSY